MADRDLRYRPDSTQNRPHWSVAQPQQLRPEWARDNTVIPEQRRVGDDRHANLGTDGRANPPRRARFTIGRYRQDTSPWHWLLFIPVIVPLTVPIYNRLEPDFGGIPFYYWAQLSFALLATVVIAIVHVATKGR